MNLDPMVTCIVIFLDEERFLRDAIRSVLAQTYSDWELLLVDDGSSDLSAAIAYEYTALSPGKIRYLCHEGHANLGMSATRNLGLQHARGRYVAFLDGDDVWLQGKLAEQVALFERHPMAVMVCGATEHWYEWETTSSLRRDHVRHTGEVDGESMLAQDRMYYPPVLAKKLYPLGTGASPSASGYMITREFAVAVGGWENSFKGLFEDQVFRIKAYLHGPIYVSSVCFDRYRRHRDSCVYIARASGTDVEARRAFLRWLSNYLHRTGSRNVSILWRLWWVRIRSEYGALQKIQTRFKQLFRR